MGGGVEWIPVSERQVGCQASESPKKGLSRQVQIVSATSMA